MTLTAFSALPDQHREPMDSFEILRRRWVIIAATILPIVVAAGYAWLAYDRRDVVLAGVAGGLLLLGLAFVPALRDLRSPLLVADEHGVRFQGSQGWVGLLWSEITTIAITPHRGVIGPRLRLTADHLSEAHTIPLGIVTSCSAGQAEIELAQRRDAGRR